MKRVRELLDVVDKFFAQRSFNSTLIICLVAALVIGVLDYRGSPGVLILYLVPVAASAWYGGKKAGFVISIYCAIAWLIQSIYIQNAQSTMTVQMIELVARLITFLVLVSVIGQLRSSLSVQKELIEFIIHDLRSPISSAITGLMTLQQTQAELDDVDREMIDLALVSDQRALNLVNSILDVAKFEAGSMEIRPEMVEFEPMCSSCVEQVELWARGSGVSIQMSVTAPRGVIDPELTCRVLVNLLSNAIKYSPPETTIELGVEERDGRLHFSVKDQGPGIPPEFAAHVFEPFSQVKGTKGGTGLGLTFCRLAIQAQHGKIWVESKVGSGTTMHFTLPKIALSV